MSATRIAGADVAAPEQAQTAAETVRQCVYCPSDDVSALANDATADKRLSARSS